MTKINPKMLKIRHIDPKISKKCVSYCKIPTQDKNHGTSHKILLLVPKPTGKLLPSFRHNFHHCQTVLYISCSFEDILIVGSTFQISSALSSKYFLHKRISNEYVWDYPLSTFETCTNDNSSSGTFLLRNVLSTCRCVGNSTKPSPIC